MSSAGALVAVVTPTFGSTAPEARTMIEEAGGRLVQLSADGEWRATVQAADALVVGTQPIDAELIRGSPNLRLIAKHGAGTDNIDVAAASMAGIAVTAAPGLNAGAVAELTMGLVLAAARGIVQADTAVRDLAWAVRVGSSLEASVFGIVGLGAIGRLVAERAAAFGAEVIGFDPREDVLPGPWSRTSLDELLRLSDVVSLHVPLTDDTRHLIDGRALGLMKPTAILVNTSRGGVVDEMAVAKALARDELGMVALDVLAEEPPSAQHPLLGMPAKTILTPHMAGYTNAALAATSLAVAHAVRDALVGTWPAGAINTVATWRGESRDR